MKIGIISAYPPSKGTLTEYAYHLVAAFAELQYCSEVLIYTDYLKEGYPEPEQDKIRIIPCWRFNAYLNFKTIGKAIIASEPDVVLFNIQFLSFGDKKVAATLGLLLPLLLRRKKILSAVLLHNITETVDYASAGITNSRFLAKAYDMVGTQLTKLILKSDRSFFTLPKYVEIIRSKYGVDNAYLMPHGTFPSGELPLPTPNEGRKTVMTFGKFGTYKKVEVMIKAVLEVRKRRNEEIKIVIAGTDNPNVAGYLDKVKALFHNVDQLEFTGYVEEEDVPRIFREATLAIFPYTSTTGSSGVLHQAGGFRRAAALPLIGDLKALITEEGYAGSFFKPEDVQSMADAIEKVLYDDEYRHQLEEQNYAAAHHLPMSDLVHWYFLHFLNMSNHRK